MDAIKLVVLGNPKFQQRHRTYNRDAQGKPLPFPRKVDPSAEDKQNFLLTVQKQAPEKPIDCVFKMEFMLYFARPKSHYGTGKNAGKLKLNAPVYCGTKPDDENVSKFYTDALTGIFYKDDSLRAVLFVVKMYDEKPRVEISIMTL